MSKFLKFTLLAIPVLGIGIFNSYIDYNAPLKFSVSGKVEVIEWQSRNHGMPRIEIRLKNGDLKRFSSTRIVLRPEDLKVGDLFVKISDSKLCQINNREIKCIE